LNWIEGANDGLHAEELIAKGDDVVGVLVKLVLEAAIVKCSVCITKRSLYLTVERKEYERRVKWICPDLKHYHG
jgi:hypothetical protein